MTAASQMRTAAVVGSGIAGLSAAWRLTQEGYAVTLYEADERLGGHADTHDIEAADAPGGRLRIDTGFIVHNRRTYPTLLEIFNDLGVGTQASEMSMSISGPEVEWAGALGPRGVFPTAETIRNPHHLRMVTEIPRFHRRAKALLATDPGSGPEQSLAEFLQAGRFSAYFVRNFMEPLVAAVWSCNPDQALLQPARHLFTFLAHHGMLAVFGSPPWRTVTGGSGSYVAKLAARLHEIRRSAPVTELRELPHGVQVTDPTSVTTYDVAVVATHPHQALSLLSEPTELQREILGAITYTGHPAQLHTDTSVLPRARNAWASWNFRRADSGELMVSYDLTRLQRLPTNTRYLLTLGDQSLVDPATVLVRRHYEHPLVTSASVAAAQRLPEIGSARLAFAGAWAGWGFHEDGARSGVAAAAALLGRPEPLRVTAPARPSEPQVFATTITHTRRSPIKRSFSYRSTTWLVDLDRLPRPTRWRSFEARDHLGGNSLRSGVEAFLATRGIAEVGRIRMLAQPRSLGHCFNPISVFWCDDTAGRPRCVVVEVQNTYGDRHAYLMETDQDGRATLDQKMAVEKKMYVSPFHDVSGHYEVTVPEPSPSRVRVAVRLVREGAAPFTASLVGRRIAAPKPWTGGAATLRTWALIHWQGVRIWARRLPIQPRPTYQPEPSQPEPSQPEPSQPEPSQPGTGQPGTGQPEDREESLR